MTINRKLPDSSLEPSGEFAESIQNFRSAMHHVGKQEAETANIGMWLAPAQKRRKAAQHRMTFAWAACLILLVGGALPFARHTNHEQKTPMSPAIAHVQTKDNTSDTALLEQVDSAVTESVPASLAPLAELDSLSSESSTEKRQ